MRSYPPGRRCRAGAYRLDAPVASDSRSGELGSDNEYRVFLFRLFYRLYNLYLSPERAFARKVRRLTGFVPSRLSLFRLAFAHKSGAASREGLGGQTSNERLEYLGDAVLGTVVAEYLFKKYPDADEGFLTKMRSKIVKRKSLNQIGDRMGLNVFLQEQNATRLSSSMLGNAVEALVGAVYLERGYRRTHDFILRRILKLYVDIHELETTDDNYKSQLLEACQKQGKPIAYKLISKYKQDRRDRFQVGVMIAGEQVSVADDYNKKAAEQLASLKALEKLGLLAGTDGSVARKAPRKSRIVQHDSEQVQAERSASLPRADALAFAPATTTDPGSVPSDSSSAEKASAKTRPSRTTQKPTATKRTRSDYHVRHAIRTAVAAAELTDPSSHQVPTPKVPTPKPASAKDPKTADSTSERPITEHSRVVKSKPRKPRRRSALQRHVEHAIKSGTAVAFVVEGLGSDTKPQVLPSVQVLAKAKSAPRALPSHALRKLVRDAAAGTRLTDSTRTLATTLATPDA